MMKLTFVGKKVETNEVNTYQFKPEQPVKWQAGQFIEYTLPHESADDRGENRYFTISSAPHEEAVQITTRLTHPNGSTFKSSLDNLEVGQAIEASEPMGEFVIQDPAKSYVFVAGGMGITPFRAILIDLVHRQQPVNVTLLYANRDSNIVFKKELDELAAQITSFTIKYFVSPEQIDLTDLKKAAGQYMDDPNFYISGPKPMVGSFKKLLIEDGYSKELIVTDYFPGYND